jgi:membrane protein
MNARAVWDLVKTTASEWVADDAPRLGAALAYYTMLSVAPLLVVVAAIGGLVYGQAAARGELAQQLQGLVGRQGAELLQTMLANAYHPAAGVVASVIGVIVLLLGATGVFVELQGSLNRIWGVQGQAPGGVWGFFRTRLLSFLMVLAVGLLLLASLVLSAVLTAVGRHFSGAGSTVLWQVINLAVSLGVITLLFALIFKLLPDADIAWKDVWVGAALTAVLFTIGKSLIGLYLGTSTVGSTYGAAGSLAVFLVWVYYSAQILFFGAEFTQVYANRYGTHLGTGDTEAPAAHEQATRQAGLGKAGEVRAH